MPLLTPERIEQASHICRWRGRVRRHFSVLEHTIIGAQIMLDFGYAERCVKSFLLHDLEETEFVGDVPTPDKAKYMNTAYFHEVKMWERQLFSEVGLKYSRASVSIIDEAMCRAEHATISLVPDDQPRTNQMIRACRVLIDSCEFGKPEQWWQLWHGEAVSRKSNEVV